MWLRRLGALGLGAVAVALSACGSEVRLPDQGQCPAPEAVQTDDSDDSAYRAAVRRNLERIMLLEEAFREEWPRRRLREREQFRIDYARYAHLGRCTAEVMLELEPPGEHFEDFGRSLDDFALRYQDALGDGERAVASRNRSAYGRWVEDIDDLEAEARDLHAEILGIRPSE